jgi:hypothetical protein
MRGTAARRAVRGAWAPLAVFVVHVVLDGGLDVYTPRPWLDVPMHVVGGVAIAFFLRGAVDVLDAEAERSRHARLRTRLLVVTASMAVAVLWEFAEFALDRTLGSNLQVSLANTMQDLATGTLGAVVAVALGLGPRAGR